MQALWTLVSCVSLAMMEPFNGSYFGHALSKVCQYATTYDKVAHGLSYAFINIAQVDIHKCTTWPKKFAKGRLAFLVWGPKNWVHLWKQCMKILSCVVLVNSMGYKNGKDLISKYMI
jgi:hypothetical protein